MSDKRLRPAFKAEKGVQRSIDLLYSCLEEKDWDLACLVCQALWNYCIDCHRLSEAYMVMKGDFKGENFQFFLNGFLPLPSRYWGEKNVTGPKMSWSFRPSFIIIG